MAKRKQYLGPLTDSRRWDHVNMRSDDVIVVTPPKSGTTWMQTIIALLLSGDPDVEPDLAVNAPWVDLRIREMSPLATQLEAMTQRRSLKSHSPLDGLPMDTQAQYICVFRHPLDVHFSYRKHLRNLPLPFFDLWYPDDDPDGVTFRRFLDGGAEGFDGDAVTLAHILRHFEAALARANQPNVTLFHYADMIRDLPGTFARIAKILGVSHPSERMTQLIQSARFDHMKSHADRYVPLRGTGHSEFFDSGSSGKWVGRLTQDEVAAYDAVMDAGLSTDDRAWLEFGTSDKMQEASE